ncbi:T9SS type A sorting domain-containing protein [Limnovirga soli]|uniref:T9SS type A sorting domain-containing protein n=1 Tax=Limnovirga soli TaxID=2656915 RepID=A0A8J8JVC4_9BACT|nr:T9SS type A sorting domain-containing protein [Limnovirga soli]NNV57245.1 T9SS type A sorting domain-containing protein [Limnovirga soli]
MKKLFVCLVLISINFISYAQSGSSDDSFGNHGSVLDSSIWADCRVISVQKDGKIITGGLTLGTEGEFSTGALYVARFNSNGSPDIEFGINGKIIIQNISGAKPLYAQSIAFSSDNKIIVCGRFIVNSPFGSVGLLRLNDNGQVDSSFGANGFVTTKLSDWNDNIGGMAIQADDKIVVAGNKESDFSQSGDDFVLRYMPDGSLDEGFGDNGVVYTSYSSNIIPGAVKIQEDGKIIVGDIYGATNLLFQIVRYNTDGSLDHNFGIDGIARLKPAAGYFSALNDLSIQPVGKIVAVGVFGDEAIGLARFNQNGDIDMGFGELGGYSYTYAENTVASGKSVYVTPDNKIIVTANYINSNSQVAVIQYKETGRLDSLFGNNGIVELTLENTKPGVDLTSGKGFLQQDGKILISGTYVPSGGSSYNVGISRLNGANDKQSKYVKIKKWLHRHGFSWEDWPGRNISYYAVERSYNGNNFIQIAKIFNQGSKQYTYEDASPMSGDNYYRMTTVRVDGSISQSNIISILNNENAIKIYPNPVKNTLQIGGLSNTQPSKLLITNYNGIKFNSVVTNSNTYTWNVSQLKPGNYILSISTGNNLVSKKFVKE